jgi:hypothetical protein
MVDDERWMKFTDILSDIANNKQSDQVTQYILSLLLSLPICQAPPTYISHSTYPHLLRCLQSLELYNLARESFQFII